MGQYTIEEFLAKTSSLDRGEGRFELEQERTLKINLNGQVWIRTGATVTHTGQIQFRRERLLERGVRRLLKRALAGEGRPLTQAKGSGQLFLADQGKRISILHLQDDAVLVAARTSWRSSPRSTGTWSCCENWPASWPAGRTACGCKAEAWSPSRRRMIRSHCG